MIEEILANVCSTPDIQSIEHIGKGPKDNRSLSGVSVVELSSRFVRETCLKKLQEDNSVLKKPALSILFVVRAKTAVQKKRNDALHRACDVLKKDDRSKNKSVTITWQIEGTKDRAVLVDSVQVFPAEGYGFDWVIPPALSGCNSLEKLGGTSCERNFAK